MSPDELPVSPDGVPVSPDGVPTHPDGVRGDAEDVPRIRTTNQDEAIANALWRWACEREGLLEEELQMFEPGAFRLVANGASRRLNEHTTLSTAMIRGTQAEVTIDGKAHRYSPADAASALLARIDERALDYALVRGFRRTGRRTPALLPVHEGSIGALSECRTTRREHIAHERNEQAAYMTSKSRKRLLS